MNLIKSDAQFVCYTPIDLKLADIYLYDGFTVAGVTNTDEEPAAETVVALTDCDEVVPVGCTVKFANDSTETEYVVASVAVGGGDDTVFQIDLDGATGGTFTLSYDGQDTNAIAYDADLPLIQLELESLDGIGNGDVLVEAGGAGYDIKITFQDDLAQSPVPNSKLAYDGALLTGGTSPPGSMDLTTPGTSATTTTAITLTDGLAEIVEAGGSVTFTGRRLEVKIGEGNLTYTETVTRDYLLDRGRLSDVRNGDETPMDVSFEFTWEWLTGVSGSAVPTIKDILKKRGEAAAWESTDDDECAPYCVDIVVRYDPKCGGDNTEVIALRQFRYETLEHNLRDSQISCSGKCNVTESEEERF